MNEAQAAERIVRALAAGSPVTHQNDWHWCELCDADLPIRSGDHEPECPWRLAVEWVAAQQRTEPGGNDTTNPRDRSETNRTRIV